MQRHLVGRVRSYLVPAILIALVVLLPSVAFAQDADDEFTKALAKGPFAAAAAAFVGGLLVNLTPCVYPLIVITTSVFGAKQAKSRWEAAALSTCFVLGMCILYTTLLVVTGVLHGAFGALMAKPSVNIGIAVIFTALAASSFGAFEIALPESAMQRLSGVGGIGYKGAIALGLVSGIIAAPCSGPVTIGMITWIGTKGSVSYGAAMGFAFSIGLGLPTWFVGTFAAGLPKGGKWMVWVKSFFGCVMLGVVLYYLKNAFPKMALLAHHNTWFIIAAIELAAFGLALGAVHVNWDDGGFGTKVRKGVGIVATVAGGFLAVIAFSKPKEATADELQAQLQTIESQPRGEGGPAEPQRMLPDETQWATDFDKAKAQAIAESRPMIVDFGAEWCPACKELEKNTFPDSKVRAAAGKFLPVHVDCTEEAVYDAAQEKYGVKGLPTVLIINSKGEEKKRINKFLEPDKFLEELQGID
jgi:thiol:disulfide interchange protein DsbD